MIHVEKKSIVKSFRSHMEVWEESRNQGISSCANTYKMVLFYAVECGLKGLFMHRNQLVWTNTKNDKGEYAAGFGHNLNTLLSKMNMDHLKVPKAVIELNAQPNENKKNKRQVEAHALHEAWRYGQELDEQKEQKCIEALEKILGELKKPRNK